MTMVPDLYGACSPLALHASPADPALPDFDVSQQAGGYAYKWPVGITRMRGTRGPGAHLPRSPERETFSDEKSTELPICASRSSPWMKGGRCRPDFRVRACALCRRLKGPMASSAIFKAGHDPG